MSARDYHESLWEGIPEGRQPPDWAPRLAFLLDHAPAGSRVLDVGCGEGFFTGALRRAGREALGVDLAAEPLRRARARDPALDVRLLPAAGPWPLNDTSFDVLWAGEVIEHVLDTAGWLSEVRRVLRSDGTLVLSTPAHQPLTRLRLGLSPRAFEAHFDPRSDHLRFYTRRALLALLADFGFQPVATRALGGPPGARRTLLVAARRLRWRVTPADSRPAA
ncbi:MAG TPA: class I SAM-dependent methyltransferase [Solirubrobacteraceae bacterium]|nr:class I SAM-dependent methyltransferase [Solirubrobacteraceae bacterium]